MAASSSDFGDYAERCGGEKMIRGAIGEGNQPIQGSYPAPGPTKSTATGKRLQGNARRRFIAKTVAELGRGGQRSARAHSVGTVA